MHWVNLCLLKLGLMAFLSRDFSNVRMDLTSSKVSGNYRLCTFNCRSVKRSLPEVQRLCDNHDMVVLQEHWLLPDELSLLSNIHTDFFAVGSSAVDVCDRLLVGRPYGGTATL